MRFKYVAQVVLINDNSSQASFDRFDKLDGIYLDDIDIKIESYTPDANILKLSNIDKKITQSVYSNLLNLIADYKSARLGKYLDILFWFEIDRQIY